MERHRGILARRDFLENSSYVAGTESTRFSNVPMNVTAPIAETCGSVLTVYRALKVQVLEVPIRYLYHRVPWYEMLKTRSRNPEKQVPKYASRSVFPVNGT